MTIQPVASNPIPLNAEIVQFINHVQGTLGLGLMLASVRWNARLLAPLRLVGPGFRQKKTFIDHRGGGVMAQ